MTPAGTSARVRPHLDAHVDEEELLLLADAQTRGGRLVAGEPAGHPAVGGLFASNPVTATTTVR